MSKQDKQPEQLAEEIMALWESGDEMLLLTGDAAYGGEGVIGLRLVSNCLCQALGIDEEMTPAPGVGARSKRLTNVKSALERLTQKRKPSWVLCYRLSGTDHWGMAWSHGLSLLKAARRVTTYIQCGMDLDFEL